MYDTTTVVDNILERITSEICIVKNKNKIISCVYIQGTSFQYWSFKSK